MANNKPAIGILTHPHLQNRSKINELYVRFVELGGGTAIPLIYDEPGARLDEKLNLINGVLFTGGGGTDSPLYTAAFLKIFKKVEEHTKAGRSFPCYAICLGFQILCKIVSKTWEDMRLFRKYDALNHASALQVITDAGGSRSERYLLHYGNSLASGVAQRVGSRSKHEWGISRQTFEGNDLLSDFFDILTISTDRKNEECVSTVRGKHLPITGFQWHPEKNASPWTAAQTDKARDLAREFVSKASKSPNRLSDQQLRLYRLKTKGPTLQTPGDPPKKFYVFEVVQPRGRSRTA